MVVSRTPLADKSVRDLLAAFASADPTPGGGSASALASAVGVSLLMMVASLQKTRSGSDEDRAALVAAAASLGDVQQQLVQAIDADAAAYDQVVAAYKQPKGSEFEQATRTAAIQRALRGAAAVPLDVMRLSALALSQAEAVAAHGHRAAASDAGVALALLRAGFDGARLNVDANLRQLTDAAHKDEVTAEVARLSRNARASIEAAERSLGAGFKA